MHISVLGSGYVGTTVATCLVGFGHHVTNVNGEFMLMLGKNTFGANLTDSLNWQTKQRADDAFLIGDPPRRGLPLRCL